ncbi:MAG: hypothetical protein HYZ53_00420 [Planctomycetes bacterium]|nr:hypothetical protein [Planctomycetota bacterium]
MAATRLHGRLLRARSGTALLTATILTFVLVSVTAALLGQGVSEVREVEQLEGELARVYAAESVVADVQFASLKSPYDSKGNTWLRTPPGSTMVKNKAGAQIGWLWTPAQALTGAKARLRAANVLVPGSTTAVGGVFAGNMVPETAMGPWKLDRSGYVELPDASGYFSVTGIAIYLGAQHDPITGQSTLRELESRVTVEIGERDDFSRYLWFIANSGVTVGSTMVHGLVHSNNTITFAGGGAQLFETVTGVKAFAFVNGATLQNTTFYKGYDQSAPTLPLPTSADVNQLQAQTEIPQGSTSSPYDVSTTNARYPSTPFNTEIQLTAGAGITGTQVKLTLRNQVDGSILKTSTLPLPSNGLLYVGGPVTSLKGDVNGKLTIASSDRVNLTGSLRYVDGNGDPAFVLKDPQGSPISTNTATGVNWKTAGYTYDPNPKYHDPATGDTEPKSVVGIVAVKDITLTAACPYNMEFHGAVFSATGNWHGDTSMVKGNLRIVGSLTCNTQPWAYSLSDLKGWGVSRDYIYDENLTTNPPRYFLAAKYPTFGAWRKNDKEGAWLWARK